MEIKQIVTGTIAENTYIVAKNNLALVIDPGDEPSKIKNEIEEMAVRPVAILLTHTHYDHIGAVEEIRQAYNIPVYVSPKEQSWLSDSRLNLSYRTAHPIEVNPAEYEFVPYRVYTIEDFQFQVVPTPGHSPGGVSFIFKEEKVVFTGDALFRGSVGRTDLPGSEPEKLLKGIEENLFSLDDDTRVFPGHRADTTIGHEKSTNPYFT